MSRIRNESTAFKSCVFHAVLFSALLTIALFDPGVSSAQEVKQIKFTEKHVQSFIAVSAEMAKLSDEVTQDKVADAELEAEALVKRYGFASLTEFDDVSTNISMIMSGIDQQTKKFTEPPEQIKQQIAAKKITLDPWDIEPSPLSLKIYADGRYSLAGIGCFDH